MLPWAVTLLVWLNATPSRAEDVPCIRLADPGQQRLLVQGLIKSPTFARVAAAVCRTDAIVYVELSHTMRSAVAGTCQLVVTTPANRFLRIYLNSRVLNGGELISVLGHELEHAGENRASALGSGARRCLAAAAHAGPGPRALSRSGSGRAAGAAGGPGTQARSIGSRLENGRPRDGRARYGRARNERERNERALVRPSRRRAMHRLGRGLDTLAGAGGIEPSGADEQRVTIEPGGSASSPDPPNTDT